MRVFISYRRDDSVVEARLLHNELAARFGADAVFMDLGDIPYGGDFVRAIDEHLADCDAVVAVIGPRWLGALRERLGTDDYVRYELVRAYAIGKRVVPITVGGAQPPGAAVPDELAPLRTTNMLALDQRFLLAQINALLEALQGERYEQVAGRLERRIRSARRAKLAGAAAGLAMFCAAWTALFEFFGLDTRVATLTMALGGVGRGDEWSGQVVLAAIDPDSVRHLGRPFDATWRREHARVIERAVGAGARAVAFDLFFTTPGAADDDAAFEAALRAAREHRVPVALGVERMLGPARDVPALLPRFAALAAWGFACRGDRYGAARSMVLAVERPAQPGVGAPQYWPSLALAAFSGAGEVEAFDAAAREVRVRVPRDRRSVDVGASFVETLRREPPCPGVASGSRVAAQWFDPSALPALDAPPRRLSYASLLTDDDAAFGAALAGRVLLVGLQLPGEDEATVAGRLGGTPRPGADLIAAQLDALVRGAVVRPLGALGDFLTTLAAGLAGAAAARISAPWPRAARGIAAVGVAAAFVAVAAGVYRMQGLLLAVPYGVGAIAIAWIAMRRLDRDR